MLEAVGKYCLLVFICVFMTGCVSRQIKLADMDIANGDYRQGLGRLQILAKKYPDSIEAQSAYYLRKDSIIGEWMLRADRALVAGDENGAQQAYQDILKLSPDDSRALRGLQAIEQRARRKAMLVEADDALSKGQPEVAKRLWHGILAENPNDVEARKKLVEIRSQERERLLLPPSLESKLSKSVSLEFRQVPIQSILEVLSQASGLNFIMDPDVRGDEKATLYARNTTVEDSINLLMSTHGLRSKPLSDTTILVYQGTKEKRQKYEDLLIRTFHLEGGDPDKISGLLHAFVKSAEVYVDQRTRTLTVRDTQDNLKIVEALVRENDSPEAEVVLEIKILEINADKLLTLGVQYPTEVAGSIVGSNNVPGVIPLSQLNHLNRGNFLVSLGDPLAILNMSQTDSDAKTLANPHIRVRSSEKAKVMIGDKVPVVTTTNNTTSAIVSESINYLDVGLKLEVEPEVHVDNDVSMTVNLEVSDIVKQVKTSTGLVTYQIGSRSANTSLRLHDGETQALAGLIRNDEKNSASRIPGLGSIPILGKLFSNETRDHSRSELVLLITPHVVRGFPLPDENQTEIMVGNEDRPGQPLRLRNGAQYSFDARTSPVKSRMVELPQGGKSPGGNGSDTVQAQPAGDNFMGTPAPSASALMKPDAPKESQSIGAPHASASQAVSGAPLLGQSSAATIASRSYFDPTLAKVRFSVMAPAQVRVGQAFTLAVMGSSTDLIGPLSLTLQLPADMELISYVSGSGLQMTADASDGFVRIHRTVEGAQLFSGPVVLLNMKPKAPVSDGKLMLTVDRAQDANAHDLLSISGEPRSLTVVP